MNDLDLCLEVVSRSRQPLRYIWRWISRKPLEIEVWFQWTTNRKWHMGYRMVTWSMTSRYLERSNSWPHYSYSAISRKLLELETSNLYRECRGGTQIISLKVGVAWVTTWPLQFLAVRSAILATAWLLVSPHCTLLLYHMSTWWPVEHDLTRCSSTWASSSASRS